MSGGNVPYHLRVNKAVDRHVFLDLLVRIHGAFSLAKHAYIGFGGPFLEDFRLVHNQLGLKDLVSLEIDTNVMDRQAFNLPFSRIRRLLQSSGDFIANYNPRKNAILWFDYAAAKETRVQVEEMQLLLPKLLPGDVYKITINANPNALNPPGLEGRAQLEARIATLRTRLGDFLPTTITEDSVSGARSYAKTLLSALLRAARESVQSLTEMRYLPVTAFRYADGPHQMLTATWCVLPAASSKKFIERAGFTRWDLFLRDEQPVPIDVPALSVKERLFVDARLPSQQARRISRALRFYCGKDEEEAVEKLESYARFYRHLPYFSRIVP